MRVAACLLGLLLTGPSVFAQRWGVFPLQVPRDSIPPDAPADVRAQIERLYSEDRGTQVEAAVALGHMGPHAAAAVPFLVDLLRCVETGMNTAGTIMITGPAGGRTARALSRIGEPAVEPLLSALHSSTDGTQLANATAALAWIDDPRALAGAIAALKDNYLWVRITAAERLAERGPEIVDPMLPLLTGPDAGLRRGAADVLGQVSDPRTVGPLLGAVHDADADVRREVVEALGRKHDPSVVEPLTGALRDPETGVREAAVWGLRSFDDPRVPEAVAPLAGDPEERVRKMAVRLLADTGDPRYAGVFVQAILEERPPPYAPDRTAREGLARALGREAALAVTEALGASPELRNGAAVASPGSASDVLSVSLWLQALSSPSAAVREDALRALKGLKVRDPVPRLVHTLTTSSDYEARQEALRHLEQLADPRAVSGLVAALSDREPILRPSAAQALGRLGTPESEAALRTLLHSPERERRRMGIEGLRASRDPRYAPLLVEALADPDGFVRSWAAGALGAIRWTDAIPALLTMLGDSDECVREGAAGALGSMDDPRVPEALRGCLRDESRRVRQSAAIGLLRLGDPQPAGPLLECVQAPSGDAPDAAFIALVRSRDPRATPVLIGLLERGGPTAQVQAAWALGQLGGPEAWEPLTDALAAKEPWVRHAAAEALGELRDRRAVRALVAALDDDESSVRSAAARALGELGDPSAVPPIVARLRGDGWDTGGVPLVIAARALGQLGGPHAAPALARLLDSQEVRVRVRACLALGRIGGPDAGAALQGARRDTCGLVRIAAAVALGEPPPTSDVGRLRDPYAWLNAPWDHGETPDLKYLLRAELGDQTVADDILRHAQPDYEIPLANERFEFLRKATGQPLGDDWAEWRRWWEARQATEAVAR